MRYYAVPMEGITGFVFRNTHHRYFSGVGRYYSPLTVSNQNRNFNLRERRGTLPENNEGVRLVSQMLANRSEDFVKVTLDTEALGYEEVSLSLRCPSRAVVTKGRGSGFLAEREKFC